jgi:hypothetical protein
MEQIQNTRFSLKRTFNINNLWNIGTTFLAFSIITILLSRTVADPDLWGHLRFGLDTLQAGTIIQADPYSYLTIGQRWINHEWLAEVLFALAWKAAGALGLILLKMIVGFLMYATLYWYLRTLQLKHFQAMILVLLLGIPLISFLDAVRPQMFTYLFFALILLIIRQAELGKYRWLWAAPPLMILWANLHGGFLAGLGLLFLWAALHLAVHLHAWKQIIPPTLAGILAILINPYGLDLLTFLFRTATVQRPEIIDWQPLKLVSFYGLIYLLVLMVSIYWLAFSNKPRRPLLLILFGITVLLPWIAARHLPLFYIASLVFISEHAGSAWSKAKSQMERVQPFPAWIASLPIVMAAALLILVFTLKPPRIQIIEDYPIAAVVLLNQSGVSGNLVTEYNWGEYIIWHLGPQIKVSMDGRRETIYSNAIYQQNLSFRYGFNDWDALLRQNWTDMALVGKHNPDYNLLSLMPGWLKIYEDSSSALFVNQRSTLVGSLRKAVADFAPPEANGHFP